MPSLYPGAIDEFPNPTPTSQDTDPPHATQHAEANNAIEAIEGTLGINPQGTDLTVSARLARIDTELPSASAEDPAPIALVADQGTAETWARANHTHAGAPLSHVGQSVITAHGSGDAVADLAVVTDGLGGLVFSSIATGEHTHPPTKSSFPAAVADIGGSAADEIDVACTITSAKMRVKGDAPDGSDLVVQVRYSGDNWATHVVVTTLTITAGTKGPATVTGLTQAVAAGGQVAVEATSVGSTTPASDVSVFVYYGPAA